MSFARLNTYLYKNPFLLLFILIVNLSQCAVSHPDNPLYALSPALGLEARQGEKGEIILTFYSANTENDFDGFNVYISEIENLADTIEGNTPLLPNGIEPTIQMSFLDVDSDKKIKYSVRYRDSYRTPLASGARYFFIVKAHSSNNYVSFPSNEVNEVAP